jgi:hypothetical protein
VLPGIYIRYAALKDVRQLVHLKVALLTETQYICMGNWGSSVERYSNEMFVSERLY